MSKCKYCGSNKIHRVWKSVGGMIEYLDYYICQICGRKTEKEKI